jgi:hypothetical protein
MEGGGYGKGKEYHLKARCCKSYKEEYWELQHLKFK